MNINILNLNQFCVILLLSLFVNFASFSNWEKLFASVDQVSIKYQLNFMPVVGKSHWQIAAIYPTPDPIIARKAASQ